MAQAPSPTTSIPMTLPPSLAKDAVRITQPRPGWAMADGSVVYDDGEKVVPPSGLSDAQKRADALAAVLGTLPALQEGASTGDIDKLRTEVTRAGTADVNTARRAAAKEIAALPPSSDDSVTDKRLKSIPPSAEEQLVQLRVVARGLINAELARIEQLKEMAIGHNLVVGRDGQEVKGNVPQMLHDLVLNALAVVQRGDLKHIADALRELKRWSVIGAPDA